MSVSSILGFKAQPFAGDDELALFEALFKWYVALSIPYETISNARLKILVKSPREMARGVVDGWGGHCVDQAYLLAECLAENGIQATFCSADHTDYISGTSSVMDYSYVVARAGGSLFLCDSLYEKRYFQIPDRGGTLDGQYVVRRLGASRISIMIFDGSELSSEDLVREDSGIVARIDQFRRRYSKFSPFGVITPYYRTFGAVRKSLFYSPALDSLVMRVGAHTSSLSDGELHSLDWIPFDKRMQIESLVCNNRAERDSALAFLKGGEIVPDHTGA